MTDTGRKAKPAETPQTPTRPECPMCGSAHTQPFTFGGPVARVNMKCTACGHLFKRPR